MRTTTISLLLGATLLGAAGCATPSGTGAATGAIAGGAIGGLAGGTSGLIVGSALGGILGYGVGRAAEVEHERQVAYALDNNRQVTWVDPETGRTYRVVPQRQYIQYGRECRQFRVYAEPQWITTTACRRSDGNWESV